MRFARLILLCVARAGPHRLGAGARRRGSGRAAEPETLPPPLRRGAEARVHAHAVLLLAPGPRRRPLRVRALEEPGVHRGRHLLVGREAEVPRRLDPGRAPVADREPVRALRPRPRDHADGRDEVEHAVRLQRPLGHDAAAARVRPGHVPLVGRAGRDELPRLVRRRLPGQGRGDEDERRRPSRVLHLPPDLAVHRQRPLPRPRGPQPVRLDPDRPSRRHARPVEPDLHLGEPRGRRRRAGRRRRRSATRPRRRRPGRRCTSSRPDSPSAARRMRTAACPTSTASTSSATATASTRSSAAPWSRRRPTSRASPAR